MDESRKKQIQIGAIAVCVVVAVLVIWGSSGGEGDTGDIPTGKMTWVLCRNPACEHSFQMPLREYYKKVEEIWDPSGGEAALLLPALTCPKCGKASLYQAVKCPKCGLIFEKGSVDRDYEDRCPDPKCKYSETEAKQLGTSGVAEGGG